jgi:hypothetical protein
MDRGKLSFLGQGRQARLFSYPEKQFNPLAPEFSFKFNYLVIYLKRE